MTVRNFNARSMGEHVSTFAVSPYIIASAKDDAILFELAEELNVADHMLKATTTELSRAERRLERTALLRDQEIPAWFARCEEAEAAARAVIEALHDQIADTRAYSKAGLAIKLQLLAMFYRDDPTSVKDNCGIDIASRLLRSILEDTDHEHRG